MNKSLRIILTVLLALLLIFSFSSCFGKVENPTTTTTILTTEIEPTVTISQSETETETELSSYLDLDKDTRHSHTSIENGTKVTSFIPSP